MGRKERHFAPLFFQAQSSEGQPRSRARAEDCNHCPRQPCHVPPANKGATSATEPLSKEDKEENHTAAVFSPSKRRSTEVERNRGPCGGSLVYLFSKRPLSLNKQHVQHARSFPVRRQSHLQLCAEMLSSQAHVATQSAIGKREDRLLATLALASETVSEEECVWFSIVMTIENHTACFSERVPLLPEGGAP
jgi:hypothetical protein